MVWSRLYSSGSSSSASSNLLINSTKSVGVFLGKQFQRMVTVGQQVMGFGYSMNRGKGLLIVGWTAIDRWQMGWW